MWFPGRLTLQRDMTQSTEATGGATSMLGMRTMIPRPVTPRPMNRVRGGSERGTLGSTVPEEKTR